MASNSGRAWSLVCVFKMEVSEECENANDNANEIKRVLSLTNKPFQDAKVNGKVICSKCFKTTGEVKFFLEGAGLKHHFKIRHNNLTVDDHVRRDCKMLFNDLHGQETLKMLNQLSELRLQMVCIVMLYFKCVSLSLYLNTNNQGV